MRLTPAIKGQLTKLRKSHVSRTDQFNMIRGYFEKRMPAEQAKHATRKYLASL